MKIQTQKYNHITVITLQGELDAECTNQIKDTLMSIFSPPSDELTGKPASTVTFQSGIVFDMNNVSFIDSAGLEFLLWARDYCGENNCQMRLAGLDENCEKIIEITRLENEFACYGELADAVKSVV